jgi:hypothetical protein
VRKRKAEMDEILTKRSIKDNISEKVIWRGKLEHIPRVGEYIILDDEYASDPVLEVHHNLSDGSVVIFVGPDLYDDYPTLPEPPED